MSGTPSTGVHGATGPLNTGIGDQHNHFHYHDVAPPGAPPLRPLADGHLRWLYLRFVPPFGMHTAEDVLTKTGSLLLDGTPGSGRNATARVLLHRIGGPRAPRGIVIDPAGNDGDLGGAYVGEGDRLLLDLAEAEPSRWTAAHERLPALHQAVQERGGHLVVIMPHSAGRLSNELAAHRRTITRPDGWAVLSRALRCDDFPLADHMEELAGLLHAQVANGRPMREIGHLARLLDEARRSAPRKSLASWCSTGLAGLHDLGARVTAQFGEVRQGPARALLFTTAMLPGGRPEALHAASEELLRHVGHPADDRPLLEREDFAHRIDEIGASHRDDGKVTFDTADYAAAVRTHFWTQLPGMWPEFRGWVDQSLRLPSLTAGERDILVACCAEQCLTTGQYEPLLALAQQWAGSRDARLFQAAVQVLGHGLSDVTAGVRFRRRVLDWATLDTGIPLGLARALVAVSTEVIASTHPDQALVRLHQLARRTSRAEHGAMRQLVTLALSEPRLHRLMLVRLARGLTLHGWSADVELFRRCAAPRLLTSPGPEARTLPATGDLRAPVVEAWHALFSHHPESDWLPMAKEWLTAADATGTDPDSLLDVLIEAAKVNPAILARLYTLSLRHPCASRLRQKIDAAQGLEAAPSPC
ncbi:hypothetical protein OG988_31460 [Streptomyces zaomyceticus]|uniref:ATP-binding protein n=2 Tax=Streptomyces zaomyceticus TaxID=68286 RepID=A0ABZ1LL94_9ACTN